MKSAVICICLLGCTSSDENLLAVASNRGNMDRHNQAGFERRDGFGLLIAA
jgi:hypothetical protein